MVDERSANAMAPPGRVNPHRNQLGLTWRLGGNPRNQANIELTGASHEHGAAFQPPPPVLLAQALGIGGR